MSVIETVELNSEQGGEDLKEAFEQVSFAAKFVKLLCQKVCVFICLCVTLRTCYRDMHDCIHRYDEYCDVCVC